jgi:hypothetical protein
MSRLSLAFSRFVDRLRMAQKGVGARCLVRLAEDRGASVYARASTTGPRQ